jgi:cobalt-zinc-cadmium efflux system outer membrane protein
MSPALSPRVRLLVALCLLVSVSLVQARAAFAEAPETTLPEFVSIDDAVRIFRQRGYDLLIADAQAHGAEGDAIAAGAIINPVFSVGPSYTFFKDGSGWHGNGGRSQTSMYPGTGTPWGVTASLGDNNLIEDALSGKRGLRKRVAQSLLAAARLGRADAQRVLEAQVKGTYIGALLARDLLDFAGETQKSAQQTYDLMHVRLQAGAVSEADEAKVETAKLEADQAVDQATEALRVAKLALAFLLGVRGRVPEFHVDQDLPVYVVPAPLAAANPEQLLDEAMHRRPDLMIEDRQREAAQSQLKLARRLRIPDLNLNLNYSQQAGTTLNSASPPTFILTIGGILPLWYHQRGEIMKAQSVLNMEVITRRKLEAQVTTDVETAWTNFEGSRKLITRMQGRLLDRAKRARDLVEIQYRKGAASLLELLDAQRTFIATNVEYYQDLANYWTAIFQLEQATGMELRQ